jgi:2,3,4,5-tetrahydropyridine-2-carboxylate N-succinyltransferase
VTHEPLRQAIERLSAEASPDRAQALPVVDELLAALEQGSLRAAEPAGEGWKVNRWVKQGILLAFRVGQDQERAVPPVFSFRDRDTLPPLDLQRIERAVRIVPGGSSVRRGAYLGAGVVIMPPAYVNVGAYVDEGTLVDSHALVGSCAQVGKRVHLSAAAQVGGVLEPAGALPVIVEDDAFVGGGCGLYEGTRVGRGAVLAAGVVLTRALAVYDLCRAEVLRAREGEPLTIPAGAVVVPGVRAAGGEFAERHRIGLQTPVIVKYRDASTAASVALEQALR